MNKRLIGLLVGATMAAAALPAQAMPAFSATPTSEAPELTLVSGGCGLYFHRGPFGGCRPNGGYYRPYGFYGRPFYPGYRYGYGRRFFY